MHETQRLYANETRLTLADTPIAALDKVQPADALLIVTEWKEFRVLNFETIKARFRNPVIVDGRNLYEPSLVQGAGVTCLAIGRGNK